MLRVIASLAAYLALAALPALASSVAASQQIEKQITETTPDGSVTVSYVPAERTVPGDRLKYTVSFSNNGQAVAENVVVAVPVPAPVSYIENSARMAGTILAFSADGGASFAPRGELVITVDGEARAALAEEITHLRWTVIGGLMPGQSGTLSFDAVVR